MIKQLLTIITGLLLLSTQAISGSLDEFIDSLSVHQKFSASFIQITLSGDGISIDEVGGTMQLQRPDKFFWTAMAPQDQQVISNGNTLWIYDVDLEQVTIQNAGTNLDESPAVILSGNRELIARQYTVSSLPLLENKKRYRLVPISSTSSLTAIEITMADDTIQQLRFEDSLGQTTLIELGNFDFNPDFNDRYFEFVAPSGVDVLDQR